MLRAPLHVPRMRGGLVAPCETRGEQAVQQVEVLCSAPSGAGAEALVEAAHRVEREAEHSHVGTVPETSCHATVEEPGGRFVHQRYRSFDRSPAGLRAQPAGQEGRRSSTPWHEACEASSHPVRPPGIHPHVVVHESHDGAPGSAPSSVARVGCPRELAAKQPCSVSTAKLHGNRGCARRVDDHDLVAAGERGRERAQAAFEQAGTVLGGDDDGEGGEWPSWRYPVCSLGMAPSGGAGSGNGMLPHAASRIDEIRSEVESIEWYHTMELAPGVVTPGWFDLRPVAGKVGLAPDLSGMRCLDVGTFDGFWAFELERRGAAEVVALDVVDPELWDWPAGSSQATKEEIGRRKGSGQGFAVARRALGSRVSRVEKSVYDLDPATEGMFDLVYLGSLLLHLRDPVSALGRVRSVCRGKVVVVDALHVPLSIFPRPLASLDASGRPWWWKPNRAGLARMAEAAGLRPEARPFLVVLPPGPALRATYPGMRDLLGRGALGRGALGRVLESRFGELHAVLHATPV